MTFGFAADVIADFVLVVTPLKLWRNAGLSRSTKILVLSSFSSSILITAVTIPHSIILIKIRKVDMVTIIFAHVKVSTKHASVFASSCNNF